jgi:hypothetical protein
LKGGEKSHAKKRKEERRESQIIEGERIFDTT